MRLGHLLQQLLRFGFLCSPCSLQTPFLAQACSIEGITS